MVGRNAHPTFQMAFSISNSQREMLYTSPQHGKTTMLEQFIAQLYQQKNAQQAV
ncbi:unknown [[Mannheimia] succiniciproducens MBEL55E]|uniref:Uncharacterized protein n=1 Tax=Mannheimia succiniciproducens (strain KCTC 0769BP / MBEL55E) TaxID=221988 RepID=Q65QP1_MANSM|nr:unknown [[Mannheimia] succiniciproducens MBEL55E]